MHMRKLIGASLISLMAAGGTMAGEAGDILAARMADGHFAAGLAALGTIETRDNEALFAEGMLTFAAGIERFVQAMNRHGFRPPADEAMAMVMGVPVTAAEQVASATPLDYEGFRAIAQRLVSDMDAARDLLSEAGQSGDYAVPIDILSFRMDVNGDGVADETESLRTLALMMGEDFAESDPAVSFESEEPALPREEQPETTTEPMPEVEPEGMRPMMPVAVPAASSTEGDKRLETSKEEAGEAADPAAEPDTQAEGGQAAEMQLDGSPSAEAPAEDIPADQVQNEAEPQVPSVVVVFDRADAFWLAGYSQVVASQADLLLAHDFSDLFNSTFHRLFPDAGLPMAVFGNIPDEFLGMLEDMTLAADAVAFIHTLNFPVVDQPRMQGVRQRLLSITDLSRRNWEAILAETDDQRELVPSPRQTPLSPEMRVTEEMVAAWMQTLDSVDALLEGELLLPHWRFAKGFNLKSYFETATRTDLVMILTGYGALPFLSDGPIADMETFRPAMEAFGEEFPLFVIWFN